jgi:heterodisulfide reductase subunit C2
VGLKDMITSIWELFNKEDLFECYQCARCTGSCPAAMVMKCYGPREILLRCLNLGQEAVITDERVWYCTTCHVCEDRCPQEINISELLTAIFNLAAQKGNLPEKIKFGVDLIAKTGRSLIVNEKVLKDRQKLSLPALDPLNIDEIEGILKKTGLNEVIELS